MRLFLTNFLSLCALWIVVNVIIYWTAVIHPITAETLILLVKVLSLAGLFTCLILSAFMTTHGISFIKGLRGVKKIV